MNSYKIHIFILLMLILVNSCEKIENYTGKIVINEIMPVNSSFVADQDGEYDDWIELYNLTSETIDLSGHYLSDSKKNPGKWAIPSGTKILGNSYLIIWADSDTTQNGLHTNYNLSAEGEKVILSHPDLSLIDEVEYPAQHLQLSYSRNPNGTGAFVWQVPTFYVSNNK